MFGWFRTRGIILLLVSCCLVGCIGAGNRGGISLTGVVTSGDQAIPVKGAEVRLTKEQGGHVQSLSESGKADLVATTSSDGRYRFDGLSPGTYEITVLKDGYNPLTLRRTLNRSSNLPIAIRSFMGVLHFSDSTEFNNFQLAAYVYPYSASVVGAKIVSPNRNVRNLEYNIHFDSERFSTWWNDTQVEIGLWQVHVFYSNSTKTTHSFNVDQSHIPGRPELISPIAWEEVDIVLPEMNFTIPTEVNRVESV